MSDLAPPNSFGLGESPLASAPGPEAHIPTPGLTSSYWRHPGVPTLSEGPTAVPVDAGAGEATLASLAMPASPAPSVGSPGLDSLGQSLALRLNALFGQGVPGHDTVNLAGAPLGSEAPTVPTVPKTPEASSFVAGGNPFVASPHFDGIASAGLVQFDDLPLQLLDAHGFNASTSNGAPHLSPEQDTVESANMTHGLVPAVAPESQPDTQQLWLGPGSQEVPELDTRSRHGLFAPHHLRAQFPILQQRVNGKRLVWLDNAATTQKPQVVIDRLKTFYERENSNIHRAAHTLAARATDAYEGARKSVQRFINAPSVDSIVFVRGATEAINLVAQTFAPKYIGEGDEIVISWLEHHANIVPWQQFALQRKARLRVAPVDDNGDVILSEYERLLNSRTRLVAFTQVSNAIGTVTPAQEMIAMAHRRGAHVLLDGAQSISHMPVDVQALDCDFFVFSGHKVFGPTGIGALYGKSEVLESLPPWQGGGNMIQDVTFERVLFQKPPARFEAGTGNIADAVGLGAALDWLSEIGVSNVENYEHELLEYGIDQLRTVPGLHMIGKPGHRAGVLSFILRGVQTEQVGGWLDKEGIAVRSGHHCAQPILRRFGVEASIRASLAPYNTHEDIDVLVAALRRIQLQGIARSI
jgi:cysteine desulfurase/selenocysteine lyase